MNAKCKTSSVFSPSRKLCLAVLAFISALTSLSLEVTAAEPHAGDWVRLTEHAAFSPRDTAEGVVFTGKMWLSNGYVTGGTLAKDLWSSSDGVTWTLITTNAPYASPAACCNRHISA